MYNLDIPGWMGIDDLRHLEILAKGVPQGGKILEVGAYLGRSTWCLAKTAPHASVLAVDLWDPARFQSTPVGHPDLKCSRALFEENVRDCPNVTPLQVTGFPDLGDDRFDLIFIDANHSNPHVAADLRHYVKWLTPDRNVLAGDDYSTRFPDVIYEVNRIAHLSGCWFQRPYNTKLWVCEDLPTRFISYYRS